MLAICLSSKSNLCIHKAAKSEPRHKVDNVCRSLTLAPDIENATRCSYYDTLIKIRDTYKFPKGVYTLADLQALGHSTQMCPYFLARQFFGEADVVVMSQQYMLDPRWKSVLSTHLDADAIVVFDDCTNIEGDCIDYLSLHLNRHLVE